MKLKCAINESERAFNVNRNSFFCTKMLVRIFIDILDNVDLVGTNAINKNDLNTYYNVGKILSEAGKHYGEEIIKEYSKKLTNELGEKYDVSTLKRMRQFYHMIEKGAPLGHHLSWSHYRELLPIKDINKIKYYIMICEKQEMN